MFLFLLSAPSLAQEPAELTPEAQVTRAEATLKAARASLEDAETPDTLATLSERAQSAKDDANAAAKALQPQLAQLTEQLVPLGEVAEGSTEAREVAVQRTSLTKQRNAVDGTIKRAELAVVNANQLTADIEKLRASQFSEELGRKVASPLSPALWAQVAATAPTDTTRVLALYRLGTGAVRDAVKRKGWGLPLLGLGVALVLFFPVRLWLRALGRRYAAAEHAPKGRLRRTGLAVWLLVVGTLLPGLAAWALVSAMDAVGAIPPRLQTLSNYFLGATCFSAFIVALSSCLLAPKRPSWRLLELDDRAAGNLRKYAWSAAVVSWVSIMLAAVDRAARTSEINTIALDGVIALIYLCLIMAMLVTLSRLHRRQTAEAAERAEAQAADSRARGPAQRSGWIVLTRVAGNVVVVAAIIASLLGYLNFAKFVTSQLVWGGIVALTTSLLLKFADDLCTWMLHPDSRVGRTVVLTTGLSAAQVEQAGVLLSAFSRIALVLMALLIFTAPFGNLGSVMGSVEALSDGIPIGPDIRLQPGKILLAVVVLLGGLALMQALQRWLVDTYLPKTELDSGAQNSISTVARYLGIILAVLWALGALGIGFGQLALVVSALSVGIGFGLQAITQNFVSGLILLAERPVKIGDWIKIGDQEGDIRRINVRSTEITVGDKSTLIVPNSELITKTVRNMTMGSAQGRIQIQFTLPLNADVAAVKQVLLDSYEAHSSVLSDPAPSVFIDSISGGQVAINSFAYVPSPRQVYGTRSDLFFTLLQELAARDIALSAPTDIHLVRDPDAAG
ncbi:MULTISPECIES: DUF3772 domain-containing protein [unclassified Stenotrophomonas]|uniref:DUF3772 domain-containing protein n=1 Tax=unclassified Stenotrophomonas TaxID=196198 RepID=UPI0017864BB4|nr:MULTISPECIES: DUF3772 domain-containing protein [unclassified Stenotrophomonas]MBD8637571.1 mechanosensitive ion channel family protein [Stenotrophomonas sp. CFBP 13725]MBD8696016.1 mechanosensitive ion channel family protein [Stenotrophomonas sp. CFBP 13718]